MLGLGGSPDRGAKDFSKRIFYPFFKDDRDEEILAILINFFSAVQERWPKAWEYTGRGAVLPKTNGYNGLVRYLRDAYLYLTNTPRVVSKSEFAELLAKSDLGDQDFTTERFVPGSSGSAELYRQLAKTLP